MTQTTTTTADNSNERHQTPEEPAAPLVGFLLIIEGPHQLTGGEVTVTRRADGTLAVAFVDEDGSPLLPPA